MDNYEKQRQLSNAQWRQSLQFLRSTSWHRDLMLLVMALQPELHMMQGLLHTTSETYMHEQQDSLFQTGACKWRVLELYKRTAVHSMLREAFHNSRQSSKWPIEQETCQDRSKLFAVIWRSPATVYQLVAKRCENLPFKLFSMLETESPLDSESRRLEAACCQHRRCSRHPSACKTKYLQPCWRSLPALRPCVLLRTCTKCLQQWPSASKVARSRQRGCIREIQEQRE